jgi:glycosyltransferase involved in cell wall biosynthesis
LKPADLSPPRIAEENSKSALETFNRPVLVPNAPRNLEDGLSEIAVSPLSVETGEPTELVIPVRSAESNADIPPCLSVIMPVYNEAATVETVIQMVLRQRPVEELIVVNDASTDGSREVLETLAKISPRVKLFHHEQNKGKGAALATGLANAKAPIAVVQDADLEYDPTEYYLLLKPILANKADVVYGSRFIGSGAHRVLYFWHSIGNKIITLLSNMATNLNLSDIETCYKVFRRDLLQRFKLEERRFGFEPEITAKLSRLKVRIYEVPISYNGRTYAEGKKISWRDGFSALRCIIKYNFFR